MISTLQFLLVPLLACILLLVITSYFGIHVIKREIIFIDIALAQIAALGGVLAIFMDHKLQTHEIMVGGIYLTNILAYVSSLLYCLGAALIFTYLKSPKIRVPIEAFIGIAYALATTAAVIILDKGAGGDVHLHEMLTGTLLWTTWPEVIRLAIVLMVIGGFHLIYRRRFVQLTDLYMKESGSIEQQRKWDFLFYFTFGIIIIEAIRVAGVLTVFAFLILPASLSALFAIKWRKRIVIGLGTGILAALTGLYLSVILDLSASPLIILCLGILLLAGTFVRRFLTKPHAC
jgi:zinc/manganese transport system permease protein